MFSLLRSTYVPVHMSERFLLASHPSSVRALAGERKREREEERDKESERQREREREREMESEREGKKERERKRGIDR